MKLIEDRLQMSDQSRSVVTISPIVSFIRRRTTIQCVCLFTFLALISPTVINYEPYGLSWDPAYYLHNAIRMNHAFYDHNLSAVAECLRDTAKGPIMELLALPWGPLGGTISGVGLAFVSLALFIWILVLTTYVTCMHAGIPRVPLLFGGVSICLAPFLRLSGGGLMTDTLLGWCIALVLTLIPLEYNRVQTTLWPSIFRGLLWGLAIDVGMLSKVTFGFFVGAAGVVVLGIRYRRSGLRPLLYALLGCVVGALPAILVWSIYGHNFLRFAMMAAWGDVTRFWNVPDMTPAGFLKRYFSELGFALIPLLLLFVLFIRGLLVEKQGRLVRLLPLSIVLVYLGTAAMSQNRDPRFTVPVAIAMPLCLAWTKTRRAPELSIGAIPFLTALLVATLLSIPMVGKPEIVPIEHAEDLLRTLSQGRPTTVILATDGPLFNIETVELARQVGGKNLRQVSLDTLVYDDFYKRSLEQGLRHIDRADYVLFLKPEIPPGPDWTRTRAQDYRAYCEKVGTLMRTETSPDFEVFKIH